MWPEPFGAAAGSPLCGKSPRCGFLAPRERAPVFWGFSFGGPPQRSRGRACCIPRASAHGNQTCGPAVRLGKSGGSDGQHPDQKEKPRFGGAFHVRRACVAEPNQASRGASGTGMDFKWQKRHLNLSCGSTDRRDQRLMRRREAGRRLRLSNKNHARFRLTTSEAANANSKSRSI